MTIKSLTKLATTILSSNIGEIKLPYRLTFSLTNRCQAHCKMCNIWKKQVKDELTLDEIELFFSKTGHFSWINLTGGELFQRTDIAEVLQTTIEHNQNLHLLNFPTNGINTDLIVKTVKTILNRNKIPRLIVSVSMDAPPELHDSIRGYAGCWKQAMETFRELRKLKSKRFSVYLGHTIQSANIGMFDNTVAVCNKAIGNITPNDFHINLAHESGHYYDNTTNAIIPEIAKAAEEIKRIALLRKQNRFEPVSFIESRYHQRIMEYAKHGRVSLTCQAANSSCFITPQGLVYPCTLFNAPIASLRDYDMDFNRLWNLQTRKNIRTDIKKNLCPGCWTPCEAYQTLLANLF